MNDVDSFEALQQYSAFAAQIRHESLLETDQPIDREWAIALVSRLYAAAVG